MYECVFIFSVIYYPNITKKGIVIRVLKVRDTTVRDPTVRDPTVCDPTVRDSTDNLAQLAPALHGMTRSSLKCAVSTICPIHRKKGKADAQVAMHKNAGL